MSDRKLPRRDVHSALMGMAFGAAFQQQLQGAERVFQRVGKEEEIRIYEVDVVCSTDAAHFIHWKRSGLLVPYVPEDVAKHLPREQLDVDGMYATAFALLSS